MTCSATKATPLPDAQKKQYFIPTIRQQESDLQREESVTRGWDNQHCKLSLTTALLRPPGHISVAGLVEEITAHPDEFLIPTYDSRLFLEMTLLAARRRARGRGPGLVPGGKLLDWVDKLCFLFVWMSCKYPFPFLCFFFILSLHTEGKRRGFRLAGGEFGRCVVEIMSLR